MCMKGATAGVWEGRFCWISLEMSHCFKYKNGEVGPKNFMVYLLKRSCLRVSRNIFFARRCIQDSEGSHHRLLKGSLLLNLTENLAFFKYKYGEVRPKTLLFNYWNDLVIGYVEKFFWKSVHMCLRKELPQMSERVVVAEFDWKYHIFLNIKNGGVGPKYFIVSLLKRSCLRFCRNIFFGRQFIRVSERSHHRCLSGSFLLNLAGNFIFF